MGSIRLYETTRRWRLLSAVAERRTSFDEMALQVIAGGLASASQEANARRTQVASNSAVVTSDSQAKDEMQDSEQQPTPRGARLRWICFRARYDRVLPGMPTSGSELRDVAYELLQMVRSATGHFEIRAAMEFWV